MPSTTMPDAADLARSFASPRLRRRRFELLPLRGEGAPYTEAQGRAPGDSSAPAELADLISSISEVGLLQPVLAEEIPGQDGAAPTMRIVAGERRLRAARWGAVNLKDNPHFAALPAIVCPGPLSEEERRIWQLIENLAREPLQPGEQAAALLYQRCALLTVKLLRCGKPVPREVADLTDPVERYKALERIRGADTASAAPWGEVLSRLGLQLSPRRARELVRAFAALPADVSEEMDAERVALHTRIRFVQLQQGRAHAAAEIWAAVKTSGRTELLYAATGAALEDPEITAEQALAAAAEDHHAAAEARAAALRSGPPAIAATAGPGRPADPEADESEQPRDPAPGAGARAAAPADGPKSDTGEERAGEGAAAVTEACQALRSLVRALHQGTEINRYDRGSLRLLLDQVHGLLDPAPARRSA